MHKKRTSFLQQCVYGSVSGTSSRIPASFWGPLVQLSFCQGHPCIVTREALRGLCPPHPFPAQTPGRTQQVVSWVSSLGSEARRPRQPRACGGTAAVDIRGPGTGARPPALFPESLFPVTEYITKLCLLYERPDSNPDFLKRLGVSVFIDACTVRATKITKCGDMPTIVERMGNTRGHAHLRRETRRRQGRRRLSCTNSAANTSLSPTARSQQQQETVMSERKPAGQVLGLMLRVAPVAW